MGELQWLGKRGFVLVNVGWVVLGCCKASAHMEIAHMYMLRFVCLAHQV
jgi:hypothetical protein